MPAFDYENFFRERGIDYVTVGKNTKKGEVSINCPLCGDDGGYHCGCNPQSGFYGCFKDPAHRGKNPANLVKALLRCSWPEALKIVGGDETATATAPGSLDDLEKQVYEATTATKTTRANGKRIIPYPPEFMEITSLGLTQRCWDYLVRRRFREEDARWVGNSYNLRYALLGKWRRRLILPFLDKGCVVVGWQGRALWSDARLRYVSYPPEMAKKEILFNWGPALDGGDVLVIVEGPMDCLKIDFYGKNSGIRAVGLLGTGWTAKQVGLLFKLLPRYKRSVVLFDQGAELPALDLVSQLYTFGTVFGTLPPGRSDPGELYPDEVVETVLSCF
jgi:hypothetical protein